MAGDFELETAELEILISPSAHDGGAPKPASSAVQARIAALSHPGKVRPTNEDHFLVTQVRREQHVLVTNVPQKHLPNLASDEGYLMVVADGMGGMAAGEVASRLAITTGLKLVQKSVKWGFKINQKEARELVERVHRQLQEIDRVLTERGDSDRKLFGMGTTLTAAYSVGVDLFVFHMGDSRAYLYRKGKLSQLTKDHTVAQAMADAGYIAPEEVRTHNKRNALTNFLGGHSGKVKADVRWLRLADGDRILLCSDGLTEMVEDAAIARILSKHPDPTTAVQALVDQALAGGGRDNITVVVSQYALPTSSLAAPDDASDPTRS